MKTARDTGAGQSCATDNLPEPYKRNALSPDTTHSHCITTMNTAALQVYIYMDVAEEYTESLEGSRLEAYI